MPLPYSTDLRERVLVAYEHGEGPAAALARRFGVALKTVKNWVRAAESAGRRVAKPLGHEPEPCLGTAERKVLRQLGVADNDATVAEYGARRAAQTGVTVSRPVLSVTLKRLGLTRKKFAAQVKSIAPENRVCLDATGVSPKLTRQRAWSLAPPHGARRTRARRFGRRHDRCGRHRLARV